MTTDQKIMLIASVGTCLSAFATFWTVREIKKQRETIYLPELALSSTLFECESSSGGLLPSWTKTIKTSEGIINCLGSEQPDIRYSIPIRNVGLGVAKNVIVSWEFPIVHLVTELNELAQNSSSSAKFNIKNDLFSMTDNTGNMVCCVWKTQKNNFVDYILPSSVQQTPIMLDIPLAYLYVSSAYVFLSMKSGKFEQIHVPKCEVTFKYKDIGDQKHETKYEISLSPAAFSNEKIMGSFEARNLS